MEDCCISKILTPISIKVTEMIKKEYSHHYYDDGCNLNENMVNLEVVVQESEEDPVLV